MDLQNKISQSNLSLAQLKFSSSELQQQSIINLTNYPTILEITSARTRQTRTRVQRFHNVVPQSAKIEQSLGNRIFLWSQDSDSSPTTPEDKTSVMHNAFDGISGDFRPANVNRRKKRNRHPRLRPPRWNSRDPSPPSSLPLLHFLNRSIASRSNDEGE